MQLIVISSPNFFANEAQIVSDLFAAGLQSYHLRKQDGTRETLKSFLKQINPAFYNRIALHQHHEIASEFGIKRLHFKENIRTGMDPRQLTMHLHMGDRLTTSVHELIDLPLLKRFEYVFFSPVFNSLSKPGYTGRLTANFQLKEAFNAKLIALGGITVNNIDLIKAMGFQGAAVLGAIWNEPKYASKNFQNLLNTLNEDNR